MCSYQIKLREKLILISRYRSAESEVRKTNTTISSLLDQLKEVDDNINHLETGQCAPICRIAERFGSVLLHSICIVGLKLRIARSLLPKLTSFPDLAYMY